MRFKSNYLYPYDNIIVTGNKIILDMDYYKFGSIETKLNHLENLYNLMKKLINGIICLNSNGYVCANLKPSNIFIKEDGNPVISDYCQYLLCYQYSVSSNYSCFLSPEQLKGEEIDEKSDIYLCGLIIGFIVAHGDYLLSSCRIKHLLDNMKRIKSVIEKSNIEGKYKNLINDMLEYKKNDRMDMIKLQSIFHPENISQNKLETILSVWYFYDSYDLKETAIKSILLDNCIT